MTLRDRVERALVDDGRWGVVDYPAQSAVSGGASDVPRDAIGLGDGHDGSVTVTPMVGDEAIDEMEARVFDAAARAHGMDPSDEHSYDLWLAGTGFDEPHEGQSEAFDTHDRTVMLEVLHVMRAAGLVACLEPDGTSGTVIS